MVDPGLWAERMKRVGKPYTPPPRDMEVDQELREVMRVHCHPNGLDKAVRVVEAYYAAKQGSLMNGLFLLLAGVSDRIESATREVVMMTPNCPGCGRKKPQDWEERFCPQCGGEKEDEIGSQSE